MVQGWNIPARHLWMTLGSQRHAAFTRLIHDLNKQSSLKGPFTLGNAKKSPK
jgi:hypothetical protein